MVASSTISSDASKITQLFSDYKSQISSLNSGIWEGKSKDNAIKQMENFVNQFESKITSQMNDFASAVDKYKEYKEAEKAKKEAEEAKNREISNAYEQEREANVSSYDRTISESETKMKTLKSEIEKLLNSVKGAKLDIEATALDPGTFTLGDFVNYYQGNYRDVSYGYGTSISSAGCGPTSMAMVLTYLTGEKIDPPTAAKYSLNHGHRVKGSGTSWSYFADISKHYGIDCEQAGPSTSKIINDLKKGKTIIMSMGPGDFTRQGHFIVLRGIDSNGNIIVADPASKDRSSRTWSASRISSQAKQMWSFSADNLKDFVI